MAELPSGTVTFLFTDLEGSTRLWEEHPDAMRPALARHDELIRTAVEECGGTVVKTTGDGVHAVFDTAEMGVSAAVAAQRRLVDQVWGAPTDLRVRMGLHSGGAELRDGDYYGSAVNRAARLMSAAHGGQIVCSQATADLARDALADDVVLVDLGDHRLRDLARPERVFQVNGAGLPGEFGALQSLDAFPGNLPLQLSSFVGREREMARVAATLDESRVVTLTGVGGVGKTRLALQVAAELLPQFRFGAWLCELAAVRTAESVVESVATVFDVTARTGESIESALVEFLKSKALLIVLDNCEHVLEEAASLVEQLEQACPEVRVLATSREGLGVDGEHILAVPSLASPPADASSDEVTSAPAVELFAERARALKSDFQVTEDNFEAIGAICRRLDGMPLAIELAAARIPAMNPGELLARLDQRFQLLAGGGRGRVERHQTLRAVIDWSFELLDPGEQQLLVRMTVFSGGWTLDAAEAVCATDRVAASAVFALTERLVARSLVVAEDLGFQTRYRLLETIRQYGEERLVGTEDLIELRRRHSAHYLEYAAELASNLFGPDQIASGRRLLAERENILAAFAMTLETGDVDAAMQWIRTLPGPAAQIGYQVRLPIAAVLSLDGADQHAGYAFAVVTAMFHAAISGDRERCDGHAKELAALERERGEPFGGEVALFASASGMSLAFASGDWEQAAEFGDRGLEIQGELVAAGVHTAGMRASWMASAASLHATAGDHEGAVILATEALEASRRFGMPTAIAVSLSALAGGLAESEPDRARAFLLESMELRARLDYETANEVAIAVLVAARLRDWEIARELCAQAIPLLHLTGDQPQLAGILNVAARALVDDAPETAAMVQGAARHLALRGFAAAESRPAPGAGGAFSLIGAVRHETTDIIDAALGDERRRQLRARGENLNVDDAVALAIDALRRARRADAST